MPPNVGDVGGEDEADVVHQPTVRSSASARRSASARSRPLSSSASCIASDPLAVQHQPHVQQRERDERRGTARTASARRADVAVAVGDAGVLVQRAPQLHAEVHERDLEHGEQRDDRGAPGPLLVAAAEVAHGEVADVGDEQERGGGDPRVPHPERAPGEPAPQRAGEQRDAP